MQNNKQQIQTMQNDTITHCIVASLFITHSFAKTCKLNHLQIALTQLVVQFFRDTQRAIKMLTCLFNNDCFNEFSIRVYAM